MKYIIGIFAAGILFLLIGTAMAADFAVDTTTASVNVNQFVSITLTDPNSDGVNFGSTNPGINDIRDTGQTNATAAIRVTNDAVSNVDINVNVKGIDFVGTPSGTILVGSVTYDDDNGPSEVGETSPKAETVLATTYPGTDYYTSISPGSNADFWFFLDVPSSQAAASYTSTFTFKGNV